VAVDLVWSDRALKEYDKLLDYLLEEWGPDITIRVSREIDKTVLHIQNYPEHYPILLRNKNIRRCVASPQTSIYFRVIKDVVEITSLFDNRQNPNKLKL
jgi:plasmid stabilization system protein ParE